MSLVNAGAWRNGTLTIISHKFIYDQEADAGHHDKAGEEDLFGEPFHGMLPASPAHLQGKIGQQAGKQKNQRIDGQELLSEAFDMT